MARTIAGELTLPDGIPLANAAIHFTAKRTEAVRILEDVSSFFTTSSTGAYSQDVESGYYAVSVSYAAVPGTQPRRWHLGDVWVEDGDPISLTALLALNNSAADPTDSALRQLLDDAQAARDEAQAAAQEAEQYRDETASMLDSKIDESEKGEPGGVATLDSGGRVPAAQLPSYVDDVEEYADYAALPAPGEAGKIYITIDNNRQYRWGGSDYIELVASPGTTDNVPEGSSNLYHTAARVRSVVLSGISFASSAAITASDTILSAFGKIQAKLNTLKGMAFLDKATQAQAEAGESDAVGMTPLGARRFVESGNATAWDIRSSGSNDAGRWAKAATYTLLGQYADLNFAYQVLGTRYSDSEPHAGRLFVRVKQQNPMGQAPRLHVIYEKIAGPQGPQHFQLVATKTTESETEVELWVQNNRTHTAITSYLFKRGGGGSSTYEHFSSADYADVPPVGHAVSGVAPSGLFASIDIGGTAVDESSIDNWNTAYGWGNHADAGYYSPDNVGTPGKNLLAASTQEAARQAIGLPNIQSATPEEGGLLVDNKKTGAGLERVLTESDLDGGGGGAGDSYESVAAFIASTPSSSAVNIISYYGGWEGTVEGPKGGFTAHKTGYTAASPSVGNPVPPSTIGEGKQEGLFWTVDGAEWKAAWSVDVRTFGILPSNTASQNSDALARAMTSGRTLVFAGGTYRLHKQQLFVGLSNVTIRTEDDAEILVEEEGSYPYTFVFRNCENIAFENPRIRKLNDAHSNATYHIRFVGSPGCSIRGGFLRGGGVTALPNGSTSGNVDATRFSENLTIDGVEIINPAYGVNLSNVRVYSITRCRIINPRIHGAEAGSGADGIKVTFGSGVSDSQRGSLPEKNGKGIIALNYIELGEGDDVDDCMDLYSGGREMIVMGNICVNGIEGLTVKSDSIPYDLHQKIILSDNIFIGQTQLAFRVTLENASSQSDVIVSNMLCLEQKAISDAVNLRGRNITATNIIVDGAEPNDFGTGIRLTGSNIQLTNFSVRNSSGPGLVAIGCENTKVTSGTIVDCAGVNNATYGQPGVYMVGNNGLTVMNVGVANEAGSMVNGFHNRGDSRVSLIGCSADVIGSPVAYSGGSSAQERLAAASLKQQLNSWNPEEFQTELQTTSGSETVAFSYPLTGRPAGTYYVHVTSAAAGGETALYGKVAIVRWDGSGFVGAAQVTNLHADIETDATMDTVINPASGTDSIAVRVTGVSGKTVNWTIQTKIQRVQ